MADESGAVAGSVNRGDIPFGVNVQPTGPGTIGLSLGIAVSDEGTAPVTVSALDGDRAASGDCAVKGDDRNTTRMASTGIDAAVTDRSGPLVVSDSPDDRNATRTGCDGDGAGLGAAGCVSTVANFSVVTGPNTGLSRCDRYGSVSVNADIARLVSRSTVSAVTDLSHLPVAYARSAANSHIAAGSDVNIADVVSVTFNPAVSNLGVGPIPRAGLDVDISIGFNKYVADEVPLGGVAAVSKLGISLVADRRIGIGQKRNV